MKKVVGFVLGLLPVYAFAECVPVPDCASIGYTETSCDGDSLKCPFDNAKLKCFPCDSSFRFSCEGNNIASGVGDKCNGKYVSCGCVAGAEFINGECVCNNSCDSIGNIYYSDNTCSSCLDETKIPVGVVAYKNNNKHLIIALNQATLSWSADQTDEEGTIVKAFNVDIPDLPNYGNLDSAKMDFDGFKNTQIITNYYGDEASNVAAVYCYNYAPVGLESSKGQWYLPAVGELYDVAFLNKNKIDVGLNLAKKNKLTSGFYWSSSEFVRYTAWYMRSNGSIETYYFDKDRKTGVICLFNVI